ncbi:Hpt domain-containing protein [Defluviimonas sp. SAOS-178_SWC]|uniref:Hpt domain-containing protein n=1 Tax=Defluviimonas sp. SAOS-178_SWC TaxID=3121287 RepID=UPI0032218043
MVKLTHHEHSTGDLDSALARIRDDFIQRLSAQIIQLRAIQERMTSNVDVDDLKVIEFLAHQICGLARTLGYPTLGDASQRLELAVNLQISHVGAPVDTDIPALLEFLLWEMGTASVPASV